jgi:hypothetical protein
MKFWHARYGPRIPEEIATDKNLWDLSSAIDFLKSFSDLYPETIFVRFDEEFTEIETKVAYCFATLRNKLYKAWNISSSGPQIDQNYSEGVLNNPLDISDLDVPLSDFKILTMLLSDKEHE